jgi:hypothetical protein
MKSLMAVILGLGIIVALSSESLKAGGNGMEVEMIKNQGWFIGACGQTFLSTSSSRQVKDGQVHLLRINWDFGQSCVTPSSGVAKYTVGSPFGVGQLIITPSGKGIFKVVNN